MNDAIFSAVGAALAAFCVWLTVRVINRRERWAKWTIGIAITPLLYVASFGPACWISERMRSDDWLISMIYQPIVKLANRSSRAHAIASWYARLGAGENSTPSFERDRISWWQDVGLGGTFFFRTTIECDLLDESDGPEQQVRDDPGSTDAGVAPASREL